MYSTVIIADDLVSINAGVHTFLSHLSIRLIDSVNYCDDALLRIHAAEKDGEIPMSFSSPINLSKQIIVNKKLRQARNLRST